MILFQTLSGNITRNRLYGFWDDPSNPISNSQPYQWRSTATINIRRHSDPNTPIPFAFNGLSLKIGMWVGDNAGRVFKIVDFLSQTATSVDMILEDVDLVNSSNDKTSNFNGAPVLGYFVAFNLSDTGIPILDGLDYVSYTAASFENINSRFAKTNPITNFVSVYQTNNNFAIGDVIKVDQANDGRYEPCGDSDVNLAVGIVVSINEPKAGYFAFKPFNQIVNDLLPPLEGNYGDIFYMDPNAPGKVTKTKPAVNPKPVFIRLETPNRAVRLNAIVDTNTVSKIIEITPTTVGQTEFIVPSDASAVLVMSINGIENTHFTFDLATSTVTFNPVATGYGVDPEDQIIFTYETSF